MIRETDHLEISMIRESIRQLYRELASHPDRSILFRRGRKFAEWLGYDAAMLDLVAADSVEYFAGVGHPLAIYPVQTGETIVDIGCGSGTDACLAAKLTGSIGKVFGVDITDSFLSVARSQATRSRLRNVTFMSGLAEDLPLPDAVADLVISNGVIYLSPYKTMVYKEIYRVLRPGGRIQIADLTTKRRMVGKNDQNLRTDYLADVITKKEYKEILQESGFADMRFSNYKDIFEMSGLPLLAAEHGLKSSQVLAFKPR